ncbi:hypothetical protein JW906_08870 [bacterium]|nr:hypothetical protein [bacterium]
MKKTLLAAITLLLGFCLAFAQEDITVEALDSTAAEGLDLEAVGELFKDSKNLEEFEKALNDPDTGINNLDLDENGEVDFIRIVEEAEGDARVIILQVPLAENEFQDVATIEIGKKGETGYEMQVHGNEILYGPDYYIVPGPVRIHAWPVIAWMYRPAYRPYRSVYRFGFFPAWWKPYRPATVAVYRTRVAKRRGTTFTVVRTTRVRPAAKVHYKPHSSVLVRKKTTVTRVKGDPKTTVKRTTVKKKNIKRR